jgi:uncharacterized membrane protein
MLRDILLVSLNLAGLFFVINDFVRRNLITATLGCGHSLLASLGLNVLNFLVDAESGQCAQKERTNGRTDSDTNDCTSG